jgi:DNA-binding NtrC family response regulator
MKGKSIIVVDDDEIILRGLKNVLELEGYHVDTAETGRNAVEKSKTRYYNLALLDIKLPDIEGTDLLIKMHDIHPKMVKIMVTGFPGLESAVKSLNMGADAYLMKPVKPRELLKVVREKLMAQEDAEKMNQEKVKEWIETRVQKLKHGER